MKEEEIAAYLNNELSETERISFEKWLSEKEENLLFYNRIKYIWGNAGQVTEEPYTDKEKTWQSIFERLGGKPKHTSRVTRLVELSRVAAAILILVGLSYVTFRVLSGTKNNSVGYISHTSIDEINNLELSDGSHVWLNKGTELLYPESFAGKEREVILKGEAYFEVEADKKHPFMVHSNGLVTKATGTSFNIKPEALENQVIVTLITGSIILYDSLMQDKSIILEPGGSGLFHISSRELSMIENSNPNFIAWKTGILVFENTPLEEVCQPLSDYFNITINCDQELLKQRRSLTARYDNISLNTILKIIELTLDIKVEKLDSNTYLFRNLY